MRWRFLPALLILPLLLGGVAALDATVRWDFGVPTVTTNPATNITSSSAVLHGNLTDMGEASSVNVSFEYGKSPVLGIETDNETMSSTGEFNFTLLNLESNVNYYFRAKAESPNGTAYGSTLSFRMEGVPSLFDTLLPVGLAIAGFLILVGLYAMSRRGGQTMGQLLVFIGGLALIYTGFDYQLSVGDAQIALMIAVAGLAVMALSSVEMVQSHRR